MATSNEQQKSGSRPGPKPGRGGANKGPAVIKKYANRRLYNTEMSAYVTLDDLAKMIKDELDFVVVDAKSGEDLTRSVLTQIILEQEGRGENLLPLSFLRQLIRFYGDSFGMFVPSYLELSMAGLAMEQEKMRDKLAEAMTSGPMQANVIGAAALEAMQDQARQNAAMFQQAMSMFSPFSGIAGAAAAGSGDKAKADAGKSPAEPKSPPRATAAAAGGAAADGELAMLRRQMQLMQQQLDRIANGKG